MHCKWVMYIIVLCLFPFSQGNEAQAQFYIAPPKEKIELPFKLHNNLIVIPVKVNGITLSCILDSGAQANIVFTTGLDTLSFPNRKQIMVGGLGKDTASIVIESKGNEVSIGGYYTDTNSTLYLLNDSSLNPSTHIGTPIHGIMGISFFERYVIGIDYIREKITILPHEALEDFMGRKKYTQVPITIADELPSIPLTVNAHDTSYTMQMIIDLGNSDAIWWLKKDNISLEKNYTPYFDYLGKGISGEIHGERLRLSESSIADIKIHNTIVCMPEESSRVFLSRHENGLIGNEIFRRFHLIFDLQNKNLYLKKNRAFHQSYNVNNSGITIVHDGTTIDQEEERLPINNSNQNHEQNKGNTVFFEDPTMIRYKFVLRPIYKVKSIRPNSPASKADIQMGDEIVQINGNSVRKMKLDHINEILHRDEGDKVKFKLKRNGKEFIKTIWLDDPLPVPFLH